MKLCFLDLDTIGDVPNIDKLNQYGELILYDRTSEEEKYERIKDADVVIANKILFDRKAIEAAKRLKLICITATGVNNVDLEYAKSRSIKVMNVTDYSTESVVQATFAGLFYLLNHLPYYDRYVKSGRYGAGGLFTHHGKPFYGLNGKTFGIVGLGTIGKRVAKVAAAFGCRVVYYSTSGKNIVNGYERVTELDPFLSQCDVVSIHAPLNEATMNLLKYEQLKLVKKTAYLINMGRGGIVNEADLARALDEDLLEGAVIDVLEKEPIDSDNPLLKIRDPEKLLITPHIAWASVESRRLLIDKVCENIDNFIKNKAR